MMLNAEAKEDIVIMECKGLITFCGLHNINVCDKPASYRLAFELGEHSIKNVSDVDSKMFSFESGCEYSETIFSCVDESLYFSHRSLIIQRATGDIYYKDIEEPLGDVKVEIKTTFKGVCSLKKNHAMF